MGLPTRSMCIMGGYCETDITDTFRYVRAKEAYMIFCTGHRVGLLKHRVADIWTFVEGRVRDATRVAHACEMHRSRKLSSSRTRHM